MTKHTGMHISLIICCVFAFSYQSVAADPEGSNLGPSGYPKHSCGDKPLQPTNVTADRHRGFGLDPDMEVEIELMVDEGYELQLSIYVDCIDEYISNANNDIEIIRESILAARDEERDR